MFSYFSFIQHGNGLPDLQTTDEVVAAIKNAGFKIIEAEDVANSGTMPWYSPLQGKWSLSGFKSTPLATKMIHSMLWIMESCRMCPKGSVKVHSMLTKGAESLVKGGEEGIFSPGLRVVAEKPLK